MRSRSHRQSPYGVHHGMELRAAIDACRRMGGTVTHKRQGGEMIFTHPALRYRVVAGHARKDTSRALTTWLMRVERAMLTRIERHEGREQA